MIRFVASRPVKIAVFGLSVAVTSSAFACPRPGGGGYGGGHHRPVHYAQPQYHAPPQYRPQPQPSIPPHQMFPQQPTGGFAQGQPGQPIQGQPMQGQQFPGQPSQGQGFPQQGQVQQGQAPQGQAPQGQLPQGQPIQQQNAPQQIANAPQGAPSQPQASARQSVAQAAQGQPAPNQAAQAPATQAPAASVDASMTALQILAGMSAPPATSADTASIAPAQATTDPRIGTWVAKVGNGATIRLELRADSSFVWTAIQEGKTNSFQGSYAFGGESLTLSRASDNQKLGGKLTLAANGFNFKLDGAQDAGLDFVRG